MKKQYIIPTTIAVIVPMKQHLLSGSTDYRASNVTLSGSSASNSDAYGRGFDSLWDDDDE